MSPKPNYELNREREMGRKGNVPFLISNKASIGFAGIFIVSFPSTFLFVNITDVTDFLMPMLIFAVIGSVSLVLLHLFQRHRHRFLCENREIQLVADQAAQRLGYHKPFEVWWLPSNTQILTPLSTVVSRAIVVSEGAANDILAMPNEGQIVIANTIGDLDRSYFEQTKAPILGFILMSFFFAWLSLEALELKIVLGYIGIIVLVLFQVGFSLLQPRNEKNPTVSSYETHPDIARIMVFRGEEPRQDERDKIFENGNQAHPEKLRIKTGIAYATSTLVSVVVAYVSYIIILGLLALGVRMEAGDDLLAAFLVFIVTFEALSLWFQVLLDRGDKSKITSEVEFQYSGAI